MTKGLIERGCPRSKLKILIKNSGRLTKQAENMLKEVGRSCESCRINSNRRPTPKNSIPKASKVNQVVSIDLNEYGEDERKYINERNHTIVERTKEKMLFQDPGLPLEIALCWALNAKNSLANYQGLSPNQIVFGKKSKITGSLFLRSSRLGGSLIVPFYC